MTDIEKAEGNQIKIRLYRIYGSNIAARNGNSEKYSFNIQDKGNLVDIVVYLDYKNRTVIVWNNEYRRRMGCRTHCFNWDQKINTERIADGFIDTGYRQFRADKDLISETVLIMSFDTLLKNLYNLYELIQTGNYDDEKANGAEIARGRRTVSQWNRDKEFRWKVLDAYGKQCAVCRCKEEKLLEAAHIKAVADGGNDDVRNGICLCANHHLMFDEKLIEIDFKNMCLSHVADSVKNMPWYDVFVRSSGKLVQKKEEK